MTEPEAPAIVELCAVRIAARIDALAELLHACVHAGASINFVLPFERAQAAAFWREAVLPPVEAGQRCLLAVPDGGRIAGAVQLAFATQPNQPHRAEVSKLMVHPALRRRGLGRQLMHALERRAAAAGRTLLTLDTRSGDPAETLYAGLGYRRVGEIPGYCRNPFADRFEATTVMYKTL